jgi:hypothetical protein
MSLIACVVGACSVVDVMEWLLGILKLGCARLASGGPSDSVCGRAAQRNL